MVFWGAFWYFMEDCFGPSAFKYLYNINAVHLISVLMSTFSFSSLTFLHNLYLNNNEPQLYEILIYVCVLVPGS